MLMTNCASPMALNTSSRPRTTSSTLSGKSANRIRTNCRTNSAKNEAPTSTRSTGVTSRPPVTKLRIKAVNAIVHTEENSVASVSTKAESTWLATG